MYNVHCIMDIMYTVQYTVYMISIIMTYILQLTLLHADITEINNISKWRDKGDSSTRVAWVTRYDDRLTPISIVCACFYYFYVLLSIITSRHLVSERVELFWVLFLSSSTYRNHLTLKVRLMLYKLPFFIIILIKNKYMFVF